MRLYKHLMSYNYITPFWDQEHGAQVDTLSSRCSQRKNSYREYLQQNLLESRRVDMKAITSVSMKHSASFFRVNLSQIFKLII
jgi:hypothetical protein